MKIARLHILGNSTGNAKAFLDIETDEGLIIKGFKLINGPTGYFVGAPSEKGKDGKWYETVQIPKELKEQINRIAIEEYEKQSGNPLSTREQNEKFEDLPF